MLDPRSSENRVLFSEALRPPPGYTLDYAIGTTYSLDLIAMLRVPLSFVGFEEIEKNNERDSLELLNALRRYANCTTVFCQASAISVPPHDRRLYSYIEQSVVEVIVPQDGIFHPKVWVLRFKGVESIIYRVICMTRNLTFDPSWDLIVTLEGELRDRDKAVAASHPLADFIEGLATITLRPLSPEIYKRIKQFSSELRKVKFSPPEDFQETPRFWPLGMGNKKTWPFPDRIDKMVIISPFLSETFLNKFSEDMLDMTLISRMDELNKISPDILKKFSKVMILQPELNSNEQESDNKIDMMGLHAKLYILDAGWNSLILIGSANATGSAYSKNVEFLVELQGKRSQIGVDKFLSSEDGIGTLVAPYQISDDRLINDAEEDKIKQMLASIGQQLALLRPIACVTPHDQNAFNVQLKTEGKMVPDPNIKIKCRPVTIQNSKDIEYGPVLADFTISFEALTSFFLFEVEATSGNITLDDRFVLNIPLEGAPEDRYQRLLLQLLSDKTRLLRFIQLLLSDESIDEWEGLDATPSASSDEHDVQSTFMNGLPLFESLLRALKRNPDKLDEIARLVTDIKSVPGGEKLIPEGFEDIWNPIWEVRQEARK
jgi:hypothetical protein